MEHLICQIPYDGKVDLQPLCFKLTFDITMLLLFGDLAANAGHNRIMAVAKLSEFEQCFNLAQKYLSYRGFLGPLYWLMDRKEFRDACKTCHSFVDAAIAQALNQSHQSPENYAEKSASAGLDRHTLLEALVQETQDSLALRDQCLNVLLAGRDTTACCLHWSL